MWRVLGWVVPTANPEGAVFGLIAVGALMAAESGLHENYIDTVLSAVIATSVYWLFHAYTTLLGRRLAGDGRLDARALLRALGHDWTVMRGAALPIAGLLAAWLFGAEETTAVTIALWIVIANLVALELLAGLRAHSSRRELAFDVAVGLTMGLAVLSLRIILH